ASESLLSGGSPATRKARPANGTGLRRIGSESGYLLGDRRLAVRRLVRVDDALADGLVELGRGDLQRRLGGRLVTRGDGLAGLADGGLQLGLDGPVAEGRLLVGLDALD